MYLAVYLLLYLWGFWFLYVLVMGLYRAHLNRTLTPTAKVLGFPAVAIGYVVDLLANWFIATPIFLEPPKRPLELVTDRLSRYINIEAGYRFRWAQWICGQLLDPLDPTGRHCK